MKTSISLLFAFLILSASYSLSTPLNGTYTIGSGGTYITINLAFTDAYAQGISGPVIFDVISGIYSETVTISDIPGSSQLNTITLRSQAGNPADVIINRININNSSNIFITDLSIGSNVQIYGNNINFTNNDFQDHSFNMDLYSFGNSSCQDIFIIGNKNIQNIGLSGDDWFNFVTIYNIQIKNNSINGYLGFHLCYEVSVESNTIGSGISSYRFSGRIFKNKITGFVYTSYFDYSTYYYNNFIYGTIDCRTGNFINNTVVGGSLIISTFTSDFTNYSRFYIYNNIVINPAGGPAFSINDVPPYSNSDYNDFYNGGNSNLIKYNCTSYDNVPDFSIASGKDLHSNSIPVTFQSPSDLHLAGSSVGDFQLKGIPINIPDDIDSQVRSLIHPYKGADEADFPLPVELASFTSTVTNNNVKLSWITASEVNNSGFDIERSGSNGSPREAGEWLKISFIKGHGNSNTSQNYTFEDRNLSSGKYNYRLKQIDFNGHFEYFNLSNEVAIGAPEKYILSQNYPNPFNPSTVINFQLANSSDVSLKIYDISGKEVMTLLNGFKEAGNYKVNFNGSNFASGVYYYKIIAGSFTSIKKMILIK